MISNDFHVVGSNQSIRDVLAQITSEKKTYFGVAVILEGTKLIGFVNDADIIKFMTKNGDLDESIMSCATKDPIVVSRAESYENQLSRVNILCLQKFGDPQKRISLVLQTDINGNLEGIIPYVNLVSLARLKSEVIVYGMGSVGLTLATLVSNKGFNVLGIDTNPIIINNLNALKPHIYEPHLIELMSASLKKGSLRFDNLLNHKMKSNVIHIITVGTPIDANNIPNLESITKVVESISKNLKSDDLVIVRSTVPLGTTEGFIIPKLEQITNLKAGKDFYVSFCPERTIEGKAIEELSQLPQIIGGYTEKCSQLSYNFFIKFNRNLVLVDSIKEAELIKLANNSFRDLSFSFSNGLTLLCDQFNLDTNKLIDAANYGYPRNPIPKASPGVGGYCLTKDPIILAASNPDSYLSELSYIGRKINLQLSFYPELMIERYAEYKGLKKDKLNIIIVGMAFKGTPLTNDLRGSASIDLANRLLKGNYIFFVYDSVVMRNELEGLGYEFIDLESSLDKCNVFIFMNNNPDNYIEGMFSNINKHIMIFDGWSLMNHNEFLANSLISYSNLGFSNFRS
jgi:UDP-N-acetyl-D-mannosaminuronic acid dehydrogenase